MAFFITPTIIMAGANSAPNHGTTTTDPLYFTTAFRSGVVIEVKTSGSPTFNLQPEESLDGGTTWHSVGAVITAAGLYVLSTNLNTFRCNLQSFSGTGSVTVTAA